MHRDKKFHSNAENTIIHTFYEKLRSGSVLKVSSFCDVNARDQSLLEVS